MVKRGGCAAALFVCLHAAGCTGSTAREYELKGQVLAVDSARQEITIKHEDIPRFMPGMTMTFRVRPAELLEGRVPGDLVTATLVVDGADVHIRRMARAGFAPVAEGDRPAASLLQPGELVSDATFLNQAGEPRRLGDWRGRAVAVTFVYTRCPVPTFCPAMDRNFKAVQEQIRGDASLADAARLASVSIDPAYDTAAVLASHAASVGADPRTWEFLTPTAEGNEFAAQFGVSAMRNDPQDPEVLHNLRTAVIDPEGRLVAILNGNDWTPPDLLAALRRAHAVR